MKLKRGIILTVMTVVLLSLIALVYFIAVDREPDEPIISEALKDVDPTDMSLYYSMGEIYPPDSVDTINVDWHGGRVEVKTYDGNDLVVEEGSTKTLQDNQRFYYSLEKSVFSVSFTESDETVIDDAYKKIEIRIPKDKVSSIKTLNIKTDGEVVLGDIIIEKIVVSDTFGNVRCTNAYADSAEITTTKGSVDIFVNNNVGYSLDFKTKDGKLDSYIDNGLDSYVVGDGKYKYKVKTKTGDLGVSLAE